MNLSKQALLAAGGVRGLMGLSHGIYGDMQMMTRGYSARADVLRTGDGRDLRELFQELEQVACIANQSEQRFVDLFTFSVTSAVTSVLQTLGAGPTFEDASEYGVPKSSRAEHSTLELGATLKWYDVAWRSTWQLPCRRDRGRDRRQRVRHRRRRPGQRLQQGSWRPSSGTPPGRCPTPRPTRPTTVIAFANGDGWPPPDYEGNSLNGTHTRPARALPPPDQGLPVARAGPGRLPDARS